MRHNITISGHLIFMSYSQINDWLTDPRVFETSQFTYEPKYRKNINKKVNASVILAKYKGYLPYNLFFFYQLSSYSIS